jgi:sugar lactone lactonase YvrE
MGQNTSGALSRRRCFQQFAPDGTRLRRINLPVRRPTMLAFGGTALDEIYVTSARAGADAAELAVHPLSGGVFRIRAGIKGRAEPRFVSRKVHV